jgi:aminopeptidase N
MNMPRRFGVPSLGCLAAIATAAVWCMAPVVRADDSSEAPQDRRAFDAKTGRNLLNYPPHLWADIRHMRLHLRIPDMNDRTILASETLTVAPIAHDLASLHLNAAQLQISGISSEGRTCTFKKDDSGEGIDVQFDPPVPLGQTAEITLGYRISDPPEGLIWTTESSAFPGRAAQIYSQGESESNHYWFACHDFPNSKMSTEIIATVPRGFHVVSNGRLDSVKHEAMEPFDTFHWIQDKPHAAYLVTMAVGKFDVVDVGSSELPMPVYVPPGQGANVKPTFVRTPQMVHLIERLASQPYPWAKYAQVSVWNFDWGGMENTSATTMFESIALDHTALLDGDEDDLIVHELGHQWFGDLVTCRSWEHIWLNEGFATYIEALWAQYRDSDQHAQARPGTSPTASLKANNAAYDANIWEWSRGLIENDQADAPYQPAMVSKEYEAPDEVFGRDANPYPKGALLLHMLRTRLGDEAFFKGIADYLQKNKYKSAETFQFREAMEKAGGVSLQRFFDQWAYRPGVPRIKTTPSWDESSGTLSVAFDQMQHIDGYNPAFDVRIPVWVRCKGSKDAGFEKLEARFDTKTSTLTAKLPSEPAMIVVDPEQATLADYEVALSPSDWAAQLAAGPTMLSRLRAAEALSHVDSNDERVAVDALSGVVRDEAAFRDLRIGAAKALGSLANSVADDEKGKKARNKTAESRPQSTMAADALRSMLDGKLADARVRAAVVSQSAHAAVAGSAENREALAAKLASVFQADPSYGVRSAAVSGLGTLKAVSQQAAIVRALGTDSQHDQIRKAAVSALGDLDTPEALELVLKRIAPGNSSTLRSTAVEQLPDLAHHNPDRVYDTLVGLLEDREPRTRAAAGKALSEIGGPRVKTLFETRLSAMHSQYWAGQTRIWLRDMHKEDNASAGASKGD